MKLIIFFKTELTACVKNGDCEFASSKLTGHPSSPYKEDESQWRQRRRVLLIDAVGVATVADILQIFKENEACIRT
jgi:hypothetical protein